jgi:hypothetical protein
LVDKIDFRILSYMVETCLHYLKKGWSVVPVPHRQKFPDIDWKKYQTQRATEEEALGWNEGLAVICGAISGNLVCLDFDEETAYEEWAELNPIAAVELPTAKSARGTHVFFRTEKPERSGKLSLIGATAKVGDLISEGKLVVLPPTIHPSGLKREWIKEPGGEIPTRTLEELGVTHGRAIQLDAELPEGAKAGLGGRHEHLMRQALLLRKGGIRGSTLAQCLNAVNQVECAPPLPRFEVDQLAVWTNALPEEEMIVVRKQKDAFGHESGSIGVLPNPAAEAERYDAAFVAAPDYLEEEDAEQEWLVEGFLPTGYLVVLGGTSKAGKSCFLTALAVAVATGSEFLGMKTAGLTIEEDPNRQSLIVNRQLPSVLWCCYEESKAERAMMIRAYGLAPDRLLVTHEKPLIDSPDGLALLKHNVRKHGAKLLVIDPLYGANSAESLSDGRSARNALQGLKDLCNEEGCTAVVIHHLTKNIGAGLVRERMADSNQILATASMDILMDSKDEREGGRLITLKCRGRGTFANQNWIVRSRSLTSFELVAHGEGVTAGEVATDSPRQLILRKLVEGPRDAESLASDAGVSYSYARRLLAELQKEGLVELGERLLGRKQYQLTQAGLFSLESALAPA